MQQHIAEQNLNMFGFFSFPQMNPNIAKSEIAPTEVWTIPKSPKNKKLANKFIAFAATPRIQESFNQLLGYLPPNSASHLFGNHITVASGKNLRSAKHYVQYFDRMVPEQLADQTASFLINFIQHQNAGKLTTKLESLRNKLKVEDK